MTETAEPPAWNATPDAQRRALNHLLTSMAEDVIRLPDSYFQLGKLENPTGPDRIARQGVDALRASIAGLSNITGGLALDRHRHLSTTGQNLIVSGLRQLGTNSVLRHLSECETLHEEHHVHDHPEDPDARQADAGHPDESTPGEPGGAHGAGRPGPADLA